MVSTFREVWMIPVLCIWVELDVLDAMILFRLTMLQDPKGFVKDGDEVEIYVEGIGSLINKIKFE